DYSRLTEKWKVIEDKETGFLNCYLTLLKEKEEIGFISLEIEPRGIVLLACGGLAVRKTRKGYGTTLLLRGLMLAQEEAWKRGIYPPWAYIYSIPGPDNLVEVLDRFFRKFGFRSEISEKVEQDPEYDALAGLIKDYPDVKDREKYKHWFKRLAQPGKPSVPAAGANKEKKLSEKELPMVREVAPEDVIGPGQIGPLPVTFVRSPTYFHDFGLEPFAYLFANRPDQVVRFRFDENHGIKAPDLETILQTTSSPYQLRWAYSGVIIDWVRGVSPEASQAEIGFSEDSENYYITGKLPGTYAQERLDAALAGTYSRGEQLMIRVKSQNDLSSPYASITIAIPKKELKQLADLHRNILRRTSSLADYLLKIAQRLDEKDPSQAAFRGLLPEMVRHLFSIHTKDRAAAIAALKEAPRGVVKFAIETFIDLGDEIRVGPDNRIGSDEYGESNKTGLPLGYYSSTYHDVIEPLRLEAIKLAGARRMHEFSDRLIELLDQSKYGDLPPESKDGHFTGIDGDLSSCISQRQEAAKALANIAKVHPPTLEKLIVVAGAKHKAPWWVKVSAIRALSMIEGRDERADSVLKEALEFNDEYAGNVIYVRDQSAHDPGILRKILVPEAMLALAKRGAKDIKPGVLEMLAMEGKDLAGTFPGRDILNKIIDALGYIGDEEAVGILYKYAEDTRYDHVIRIKALHALFRIDPKSKKFLKLLLGIWFYVWDLSGIYGAPDFKSDVTDENRFVEYYQKIKELWKDKKKGHNWQTDCVRNEVVPIMMEMNVRYFMDQGMKLTHDGGTPEWEVNGSALKSLLGSNSNNQEALGELLALYWRIDHYDYVSTSYILAEDLEIFGEIIAGLDLSANLKYPEGEHSIAAADLIQAAMKPKEQMDNAFRDAVKRSTIKHLSWRMFREHEALVGEVAFSPDFAGQFQEGYLHPVKAPPPGSTEEKDIPKGGLVPPGLFTEMIKAAEDENALRDIARQISSETAEREIAGQKELFLQDMAQALEDIARESAHLRAKCDKVARLLEENGIKLKYRGPPSAASGAYRSSGKRKPTKTIVEIDARALCKTYGTISKVPGEFWEWMASLGVGAIWLKSPWQESPLSGKLMRDWSRTHSESMVKRQASGYDVYRYKFNPEVARSKQEFRKVAEYLREKHDIRVILDFVTNHIAADSPLIKRVPQLVISRKDPGFPGDQYSSPYVKNPDIIIQHARFGPFGVPSGPNLAQLNHLTPNARRFMQKVIKKIADLTRGGGFRADLAHLFLKEVIREIWKWPLNIGDDEFDRLMRGEPWEEVLDAVRAEYPDLLVVAETYGHHGKFRSMGMVPYDKQIYDLLVAGNVNTLRWFLFMNCSAGELKQSVHFIENHDEYPAAEAFGSSERAIAAAAVSYAIPGYPLVPLRQILGMGTPEGAVKEMKSPDGGIYEFSYSDTLSDSSVIMPPLAELLWFVSRPVFRQGEFYSACPENLNLENSGLIPFTRHLDGEDALCLVNYSGRPIQATISLDTVYKFYENRPGVPGKITGELKDIVRSKGVKISFDHRRITVDLPPWGYGLFHFAENELDVTAFPASRSIRSDDLPNYADRPAEWWVDHIFENNSGMGQEGLVRKILEEHDRKHNTNKKEKFERLLLNRAAAVFTAEELAEAFKNGLLLPGQIDDLKKLLAAGKGRTTLEEFQLRYGVPKIEKRGPPPGTAATLLEYMFGYDWRDGKYHPELVVSRDNPQSIAEMTEGREKRGAGKISKSTVYNERTTLEWGGLIEYDNHKKVHYLPDWVLALGFEEIIQQIPELNDLRSVWIERILRIQEKGKKLRKKAGAAKGKNEAGKKDDAGVKDEVHSKGIHERPAKALVGTCKKIYGILPGVKIVFTGEGTRVENPKTVLDFECLRKKGEKEGGRFIYRGEIKVAVSGDHPDGELRKAASVLTVLVEDERFGNGF
ncbi:MAG: alpha-amylase family glycosyl hydrolase, partial [Candidatus Omnitrophota bacterium]